MRRQDKYPNTDSFTWYNANPKGRLTDDCVARAVSTATGKSYAEVVRDMAEVQIRTGYDATCNEGLAVLMKQYGWVKHSQPRKPDRTKYTGKEYRAAYHKWTKGLMYEGEDGLSFGSGWAWVLCNIGGHHTVAVKNGVVHDTWDSTDGCIGIFWTKG